MIVKDVANKIQDDLHNIVDNLDYDIVFNITDNIQRYESDMKNADEVGYNPCVLSLIADPFVFSSLDIEVLNYELRVYGKVSQRYFIEEVFKVYRENKQSTVIGANGVYIYSTNIQYDDFVKSEDGRNKRYFEGVVDIQLQILPYSIDGNSTTLKLDDIEIPFTTFRFRKDKSLIPNISFGSSNTDVKLVSETMQIEIPVVVNEKVSELLLDVLNDSYNKKYTINYEISNITKTVDMILRVGTIEYNKNGNPITFWITLERALGRKDFKIDGITIPAIRWAFSSDLEITSTYKESGVKSRPIANGRGITVLLVNDQSAKIDDIIENINQHEVDKRFNVEYQVNDKTYSYSMVIKNGSLQVTEHPDLLVECTFIEGV